MEANTFEEFKEDVESNGLEAVGLFYGMYRGLVADNLDPEFRGRLKIRLPQIYGEDVPDYWAPGKGMPAGTQMGMFILPAVGDQVWVSFENGNPRFPVWENGWFADDDVPEAAKSSGKPNVQLWQSYTGQRIELDDENKITRVWNKEGLYMQLEGTTLSTVADKISLGTLGKSAEPAVLGDTAESLLKEFIDDLGKIGAIITSTGITSTISTSPGWAALVAKWANRWKNFKSKKVTLD